MQLKGGMWLPDDDKYFGPIFEKEGGFQLDRLERALSYVDDFGIAVDAGAHVGSWTKVMGNRFDKVLAFEAVKETYDCLVKNISSNKNVSSYNAALGNSPGFVSIGWDDKYRAQGNTGSKFTKELLSNSVGAVRRTMLDAHMLSGLDFLKLDVEGAEYDVLKGAEKTVLKYKPVVILEVKKGYAKRFGRNDSDVMKLIESFGATLVDRINADHIYKFKQ